MVYGIVTNHSGFIDMASEAGRGTTFDIYLPVPSDAAALIPAAEAGEEKKIDQTAWNGATILFVEDETHQLNLMQNHLAAEGHRVLTARDGGEAVQTYLRHKQEIDLVVLDLGLPKLNGWEAYKMMKEADPNVKAIFATGFISPEIEAHLQTEDSSAVITKPYSPSEMSKKSPPFSMNLQVREPWRQLWMRALKSKDSRSLPQSLHVHSTLTLPHSP